MTDMDKPRFLDGLHAMATLFNEPLPSRRLELYWQLFVDRCTITEWEYAAFAAMFRETFHKVPLPAHLFDYIREYRQRSEVVL